jgi:hypothetical protein
VCTSTRVHANLNVNDLTAMLATSDIAVHSTHKSKDIVIKVPLSWASTHRLSLGTDRYIRIEQPIVVTGTGSLTIDSNPEGGGDYLFTRNGKINFMDTSSDLVINDRDYKLEGSIASLASDAAANQTLSFALARDYDAGPDGIYKHDPIPTALLSGFEGLGNTISNLKIVDSDANARVGLFFDANSIAHLNLVKPNVQSTGQGSWVGALMPSCNSVYDVSVSKARVSGVQNSNIGGICGVTVALSNAHMTGVVIGHGNAGGSGQSMVGGLTGLLAAGVANSVSEAKVVGGKGWIAGGLAGRSQNQSSYVLYNFATGTVIVGDNGIAGGLVGENDGQVIGLDYATGFVGGGVSSKVGGLIGLNNGPVSIAYSTGAVASGSGNAVGGLIGDDEGTEDLTNTYWDTTTSGQSHGVGNNTAYPGVTGLTTEQFQAGLPAGFDTAFWGQSPSTNNGLPYLLSNPPG